jgi:DNA-binding transcriptional ArsR family regulator
LLDKRKAVTAVFAALADPTRRRILERLAGHGERRVTELARPFRITLPAISRHLRVLEHARLIRRRRRGRTHFIRVSAAGMTSAQKWISRYAAFWEAQFDELDNLLEIAQQKKKPN